MSNSTKRTLALASFGLFAAACTSATAGNKNSTAVKAPLIERPSLNNEEKRELAEEARELAEEAREIAREAMEQAHAILKPLEIDEDRISREIEIEVRRAMKDAAHELEEVEIELKNFNSEEFKIELKNMRHGLEQAVKQNQLTKQEMEQIIEVIVKDREEALKEAREALKEIRQSLNELHEENQNNHR